MGNHNYNKVNLQGRYPLCQPVVGDPGSKCERCGEYAGYDRPCPSIPLDKRWGPDYGEWIIVSIIDRTEKSVEIASKDHRLDGASFMSPCFDGAQPGETWAVYREPSFSVFGQVQHAVKLTLTGAPRTSEN